MGAAKTKRKILKDGDVFSGRDVYAKMAEYLLDRTDDTNVVIGPIVYPLPENDPIGRDEPYFTVATSEKGRGFRADGINIGRGVESADEVRNALIAALMAHQPLVIHITDDELHMALLCETLWAGERITKLRQSVEAENATDPRLPQNGDAKYWQ